MKSVSRLAFLLLLVISVACKKEKDAGQSNTDLITSASWKYENAGLDVNKDGFIDTSVPPGYVGDCDKDNTLTFKSDGTGTVDEGTTKCDPANPQTSPFTWMFTGSNVIKFPTAVFTGISGDVTILKLTSTELDLSKEINIGGPTTVNVIVELKH